jgi:hypothetical protein
MADLVFKLVDEVVLAVHSARPPQPQEWEAYLAMHVRLAEEGRKVAILVITEGGAPNSAQRAALKAAVPHDAKTAILTSNVAIRGVVTAFNWLGWSSMRAFAPHETEDALRYIQALDKKQRVLAELDRLQSQTRAA